MYKVIRIDGKDWKFEYTIEASLYEDFVERLTKFTMTFGGLIAKYDKQGEILTKKNMSEDEITKVVMDKSVDAMTEMMVANTTQVPRLAIDGFYAGLLENHHITYEEAKQLYIKYLTEYHKKPSDVLGEILEKVKEDNFFDLIGLELNATPKKKSQPKKNPTSKR